MQTKKENLPTRREGGGDPFASLRQMSAQLDRLFEEGAWPMFRWPLRAFRSERTGWLPVIDVFEREGRLVTKVDLPGLKKEDVNVEITDGQLVISGERKSEAEEKKENYYRAEREYGSFYRSVPLPETAKIEDITATFEDGVLEVSVPLQAQPQKQVRRVPVSDTRKENKEKTAA